MHVYRHEVVSWQLVNEIIRSKTELVQAQDIFTQSSTVTRLSILQDNLHTTRRNWIMVEGALHVLPHWRTIWRCCYKPTNTTHSYNTTNRQTKYPTVIQ